ncbi:Ribosomal S8 protein [Rutstroemia sp. NJR-2017a WRK4]|nr:Ribosomal S8 protein [Rutstroemia sp. NJR-2017a WRK4]
MSDSNSSPLASRPISAGMFDDWSRLLRDTDRRGFLQACTEAEADDERLQAVLIRYFATWRTNLMGDDLSRLQKLAASERIRDCVKVICVEDDFDYIVEDEPDDYEEVMELYERFNYKPILIWPRHEYGQVVTEALGIELLKSVLVAKQLRPDRIEIKDKGHNRRCSNPEAAGVFARNILDGADLAIKAFNVNIEWATTTIIVAELSPEYQGQGMGLSNLHSARLILRESLRLRLDSYWANQILYHAPALKELKLSFWLPSGMIIYMGAPWIIEHPPLLKLEKLEISDVHLSIQNVMAILGESQQSLKSISLTTITLVRDSTWRELLTRIASEFPHLTWFRIALIREGYRDHFQVVFPGLKNDSVLGEPYKNGLILVEKGPVDNRRISGVEYGGPHAKHVLKILAEHARWICPSNNL